MAHAIVITWCVLVGLGLFAMPMGILLAGDYLPSSFIRGRCPKCGYDLASLPELSTCPECGTSGADRAEWERIDPPIVTAKPMWALGIGAAVTASLVNLLLMSASNAQLKTPLIVFVTILCAIPHAFAAIALIASRRAASMESTTIAVTLTAGAAAAQIGTAACFAFAGPDLVSLLLVALPCVGILGLGWGLVAGGIILKKRHDRAQGWL